MERQISFDDTNPTDTEIWTPQQYYQAICNSIASTKENYDLNQIELRYVEPAKSKAYYAICFLKPSNTFIKFIGEKKKYIEIKPSLVKYFTELGYSIEYRKSAASWPRMSLDTTHDFAKNPEFCTKIYDYFLCENGFDCCSAYEQCSDAKRCIRTDLMFAGQCTYRQKLKQGIIFFGKNKNQ